MKRFKAEYKQHDAFFLRGDWLRPKFGLWDDCDPVAHAILDLVEAQNELADLHEDDSAYGVDERAMAAVVHKRHLAGKKLMEDLLHRNRWPDPELGRRDDD
jgi:hypothetical protein